MTRNGGRTYVILRFIIVFFLLCLSSLSYSQSVTASDKLNEHRSFDEERLKNARGNEEFQYGKKPVREISRRELKGVSGSLWTFLMYSFVFLMLGVLAFFIWQKTMGGSSGKAIVEKIEFETEEDIRKLDLKELIAQALSNQNYRLAIRLLYLSTLKSLTQGGLIDWQPNKTNQDYRRELAATSLANDFDLLTLQFDYIWYGNISVGPQHYDQVSAMFQQFQRKMKAGR